MKKEIRSVKYDVELKVEAYHFQGIMQKFPAHFHEYYVLGFIEKGQRSLFSNHREYLVREGDLLLFNPRETHRCEQIDGQTLDYRSINIQPKTMSKAIFEITGKESLPHFIHQVIFQNELVAALRELHQMIMAEAKEFRKEEIFFFLLEQLLEECTEPTTLKESIKQTPEIGMICAFLEKNYRENIRLDDLCRLTGFSKYYLLRLFTAQKGISPYCYLETIRIDKAKKMLEQGSAPIKVALECGFSDQSHFSHFFKKFIGLTPKQYMNIFKNVSG